MSSAEDLAPIFAIARPRCALTVRSVIPNSLAISLLRRPETTPFMTSRSRGVNVFMPLQIFSLSICPLVPVQTWQTKTNFHAICALRPDLIWHTLFVAPVLYGIHHWLGGAGLA